MFDPLGPFRKIISQPVPRALVVAARRLASTLPDAYGVDENGDNDLTRIYMHWSVQGMRCVDAAYNIVITRTDLGAAIVTSTDVRKNALTTLANDYAEHTYHRNTGAVGIALDGMDGTGVGPYFFGADPVTTDGLLYLCAAVAGVGKKYEIDIAGTCLDSSPYYGETNTLTHAEAAHLPGVPPSYDPYFLTDNPSDGDTRWDLSTFVPVPKGEALTFEHATICGDALRTMSHRIKAAM